MPHTKKISIAIIDDDEDDFFIINDYLKEIEGREIVVDWYKDYATALEKIRTKANNIYLVDYRLGNQTGLDLLAAATELGCDEPIILLTGKGNKAVDIQAMQSGATDYLIKSELNTEKLERCIRYSMDRSNFLKELKARENKYRNLFRNSKDAVFITDTSLWFIEVNKAANDLLDGAIGDLYQYIQDEKQQAYLRQMLQNREAVSDMELRLHVPGQETKICLLSLSMQQDADENWLVHGILHDITALKRAEVSNLQAEKSSANERLVRMLAHEIRNPLNNISLSVEDLMSTKGFDDIQRNLLAIVQRNSGRINQIITELLNLTKSPELQYEPCCLHEIIEASLVTTNDRINLQKIAVEKKLPDQPMPIHADKQRLQIAFNNILINAIEAMEVGKGKLLVSAISRNGGYDVSIMDNGTGIPEEYVNKLFDPFFTMKKNGMGLGLAVTYSIIKSHKGNINIESIPGKGTNFVIHLNREKEGVEL